MCIYPTRDCYLNYLKKISIIVKYTLKSYPKNENENENLVRLEYIDKYIDDDWSFIPDYAKGDAKDILKSKILKYYINNVS